ncbi:MAG: hypothetical protein F4Y49_12060 [Dehalococcoidia bacterium]|nr:hypothetical protein [Dehalococcoidia bacterium]
MIYHDPDAGTAAVNRYDQAVALLTEAGSTGDVQGDVEQLAGGTNLVMPRFFLGDPTSDGWISHTKVNNGSLRRLINEVVGLRRLILPRLGGYDA